MRRDDRQGTSGPGHGLLIWVVIAFLIQATVWAGWLTFAAQHRVAEVPLAINSRP